TLHYRVVLIAQYCWRIAVRRRTIRFDLRKLISKLFVDVLLFSFQGSNGALSLMTTSQYYQLPQ
ncbi:MAG TPA: hypothetical protein VK947_01120, partial [Planococcus sp. (in: firmicutes)]|nr:hypothetical protein [Planococcus sp. (in: firmicutes)]